MGLFVAPIMLGLRRLARANLLQLPLQEADNRPVLPPVLLRLEELATAAGVGNPLPEAAKVWPPQGDRQVSQGKRERLSRQGRNPHPTRQAISLATPADGPALDALKERLQPTTMRGWVPALKRLENGVIGPGQGPERCPKGGLMKTPQAASRMLAVHIFAPKMRSELFYTASIAYLKLRDAWVRTYDPFPIPPKPRCTAVQAGHKAFVKASAVGLRSPTEDTMNLMGIPSYVIRTKFALLDSKQRALATLGRLAQFLLDRDIKPRVRGFALQMICSEAGEKSFVRYPPNNWRRALRLISRQVVSTFASQPT